MIKFVHICITQAVHTDREVTANRPDIIIKNKKEKTCALIDVAIPADRNVVQKEAEKKLKYKSLCIEIQRMWNLKCTIIPIIIGATGIVTRSVRKNLEAVPGKHSIDSLQKTAILGTSHIIHLLDNAQHSQEADVHDSSGIRTSNPSKAGGRRIHALRE